MPAHARKRLWSPPDTVLPFFIIGLCLAIIIGVGGAYAVRTGQGHASYRVTSVQAEHPVAGGGIARPSKTSDTALKKALRNARKVAPLTELTKGDQVLYGRGNGQLCSFVMFHDSQNVAEIRCGKGSRAESFQARTIALRWIA